MLNASASTKDTVYPLEAAPLPEELSILPAPQAVPLVTDLGFKIGQGGVYSSVDVRVSCTTFVQPGDDAAADAQLRWVYETLRRNSKVIDAVRHSVGMYGSWALPNLDGAAEAAAPSPAPTAAPVEKPASVASPMEDFGELPEFISPAPSASSDMMLGDMLADATALAMLSSN